MASSVVEVDEISPKLRDIKVILSDVEGTTTSLPFVRTSLRYYYIENLNKYLSEHWNEKETQDIILKMKYECDSDDPISTVEEAEKFILHTADSKNMTYSQKLLQTKVWEEGYTSDALKGHLFHDVVPCFKKWVQNGKSIYLYSSAIKLAQSLLFTHSVEGNVYNLISGCFDPAVGSKDDFQSYKNVLEKLEYQPEEVLFLTDNVLEAEAATKAGILSIVVHREGNDSIDEKAKEKFLIISTFEEITPYLMEKKKKLTDDSNDEDDIQEKKAKLEGDEDDDDESEKTLK